MPRIIKRVEPTPKELGRYICTGSTDAKTHGCESVLGVAQSDLFRVSAGGAAFTCPVCGVDTVICAPGTLASAAPTKSKHGSTRAWEALIAEVRRSVGTNALEMDKLRFVLTLDRESRSSAP